MTDFSGRYGQWAVVAGAAEGIGAAFCEELAKKGMNVIMVDVKDDGMESLAKALEMKYKIETLRLVIDLADKDAPDRCMEAIIEKQCRFLIYNAAYSRVKPFLDAGKEELDLYINVNSRTPIKLVHDFANWLNSEDKQGGILLMSSLAGLWGTRLVASYSGTKAFNITLAEALHYELKPCGIAVNVVCAGATATPGYLGTNPSYGFIRPSVMKPAQVASIALKKMGGKTIIIPGRSNRLTYFLMARILPRSWAAWLMNSAMERMYRNF